MDAQCNASSKTIIAISVPKSEPEITPKTNMFLFMAHFYAVILIYIAVASFSPDSSITQAGNILDSFWANFIFLGFIFFIAALTLHLLTCFLLKELLSTEWFKPKLGNVGLREGYLTEERLKEALDEQKLRIGEILVQSGRLSNEQLNQTLERQKKVDAPLGQILKDLGYATSEDVDWALSKMGRKLGEILREKRILTTEDLVWLLGQQKFGPRRL
jgi:hypothetical protein